MTNLRKKIIIMYSEGLFFLREYYKISFEKESRLYVGSVQ